MVKHTFITVEGESDLALRVERRAKTESAIKLAHDEEERSTEASCEGQGHCTPASSPLSGSNSTEETEEEPWQKHNKHGEVRTTVMLKHLPNNYTRAMFLEMLNTEGFAGTYDFVYLPIDFNRRAGLGYAFVNMVDPSSVPRFWKIFDGFTKWVLPTNKVCEVSWSEPLQGFVAHVARYRNSPVMHRSVPEEYRPVIFENGQQVEFPAPTKNVRPPYRRHF